MTIEDVRRVDPPGGMYDAVRSFPVQWQAGRRQALAADLGAISLDGVQQVVIAGMGGSAIGADLLRTLAEREAEVPVFVSRRYSLPAFVGAGTLVVASSYSGNTEETLASFEEARTRGATIVCIASGGTLLDRAQAEGLPYVVLPGGLQPRAALGYSLTALLTLAERLSLLRFERQAWDETQALLEEGAHRLGTLSGNAALTLAKRLKGRLPVVYSSAGLLEAVNVRWRNQLHENSKNLAFGNVWPELNHNEIMGWEQQTPLRDQMGAVVLRDRDDHPRVQRRIEETRALLGGRMAFWEEVESGGESRLARVLSLLQMGDWVSLYLAVLYGVDPTRIGLITRLKAALAESTDG